MSVINIAHLSESSETGGAETVLLRIVQHLNPDIFRSHVILMKHGWLEEQFLSLGIRPWVVESSRSYDLGFVWRLWSTLRNAKVSLVSSHLPDSNAYGCLAGQLARVPVVATYHGMIRTFGEPTSSDRAKMWLVRKGARAVVAVSETVRQDLIQHGQFKAEQVTTVYNGIDWAPFDVPANPDQARSLLGLTRRDLLVGMIANLKPVKGFTYFVQAAARVVRAEPRAAFLVLGQDEAGHQRMLEEEARALGVADRMFFLGFRSDAPWWMKQLDVFVLASLSEGHPLATVEAMGAGVPAVVTRIGAHLELIRDGQNGFLVPPRDAAALADRILWVLQHPAESRAMAAAGRDQTRERFGVRAMLRAYEQLYHSCL